MASLNMSVQSVVYNPGQVLAAAVPALPPSGAVRWWAVSSGVYGGAGIHPSIPFPFGSPHPWLSDDGLAAHTRIMRGEDQLPHLPTDCDECRKIFRAQIGVLKANGMGHGLGPGKRHKRNPGRQKMSIRLQRIRERLQMLARSIEAAA